MSTPFETTPATAAEPPLRRRRRKLRGPRQVYEPHRVGLPPLRDYVKEAWRRREFAFEMSRTNLRAQHFNTVFGQLWLVINPLLLAMVYFILVDILRGGDRGPGFFAHLVAGLFAYYFLQQSVQHGAKSVTSGGRLILNSAFPRVLLPIASTVTAFKRFAPTVPVYVIIHVVTDRPVGIELLWVLPLAALLVVMTAGLTMLAASVQVYFRDLKSFLPYLLRVWLYASPVLYYAHQVPDRYEFILAANPLGGLLTAWSEVINQGQAPSGSALALAAGWAFGVFAIGFLFFLSREREFAVRL